MPWGMENSISSVIRTKTESNQNSIKQSDQWRNHLAFVLEIITTTIFLQTLGGCFTQMSEIEISLATCRRVEKKTKKKAWNLETFSFIHKVVFK